MRQSPDRDQRKTPLLSSLQSLVHRSHAPFYAPGHKQGQSLPLDLSHLVGTAFARADLPELPEFDNLFAPKGVIAESQALAADAFGAEQTWFLVNGSTCGVITAILATCGPGDRLILPRNSHQSAIAGLVLSGAMPVFIQPEYDAERDLVLNVTVDGVKLALDKTPEAKALMVVHPTYHGIGADLEAIAAIVHPYGIPLLVDEAHGAHFTFHPALPISALDAGADLSVQSTHKVLSALSQASMLHLQGTRIDPQRINQALQLLQSTSPNSILLASLDAARAQMATQGRSLLERTLQLAQMARQHLATIPGLSAVDFEHSTPGFHSLDSTRLTVMVDQLGISGWEADDILHGSLQVTAELPLLKHLTFIITLGNTHSDIEQLIHGLTQLANDRLSPSDLSTPSPLPISPIPLPLPITTAPLMLSPREAFYAPKQWVPWQQASGHISAELICPYPPGIPILMPGERITDAALTYLQQVRTLGGRMTGCSDPTLQTLTVVCDDPDP